MRAACTELAGIAVANDKWPSVHQIARSTALDAIEAARTELDALAADTATVASAAAERIVHLDTDLAVRMIASQAPLRPQEALETYLRTRGRERDDDPDVTDGGVVRPASATAF